MVSLCSLSCNGDHRDLHVLTHSFPTRRSSDLAARAKADAYAAAANLRVTRVLAISDGGQGGYMPQMADMEARIAAPPTVVPRSEEHTSELQSLMRISYAVFCLKKKKQMIKIKTEHIQ